MVAITIVLFFMIKQKWIVIHDDSDSFILFYKKSTPAKEFCNNIMLMARKLNSQPSAPSQRSQRQS